MKLIGLLKKKKIKQIEFASLAGIPKSSVCMHIRFEASGGKQGRPLGLELCRKAIQASGGELSLHDLRPDLASEVNFIQAAQNV